MKTLFAILTFTIINLQAFCQIIDLPVFNTKSHKTLVIEKIERTPTQTVFYMSISNELENGTGSFCADRQIYIKESKGDRMYFMDHTEGIPTCPESHQFKKTGEVLEFRLYFPAIPENVQEIDLIENCSDNCFYFYGVVLNTTTNNEIKLFEKGVALFTDKKLEPALTCFLKINQTASDTQSNIYAYSSYIIPLIYFQIGDTQNARNYFQKLKDSQVKDKQYFIEKLQSETFFKEIK
jgi:tetratricopeptide (TPR) repeat protein